MGKTLLLSLSFLKHQHECGLFRASIALNERLNLDCDYLLIDNAGPICPRIALGGRWSDCPDIPLPDTGDINSLPWSNTGIGGRRVIAHFPSAIGHFHYDKHNMVPPRDGPGRAIMTGLRIGAMSGYDRLVYLESDSLCALPATWAWERMTAKTACEPRIEYGYLDWQAWWIRDLQWLVNEFDFPGKYAWQDRKPDWMGDLCGELIYEKILGEHVEALPVRGGRGDALKLVEGTLAERFPDGVDYLTHASRADFAMFLVLNGHEDLAQLLA